ncbi:hypothetical protein H0H87_012405 [Tephrocybe sp. NHM501043]|nr:hypothetical protein H0H87_012405 [Tephrocybe sp. NHM501043]
MLGLVTRLRRAKERDLVEAINYMRLKSNSQSIADNEDTWTGEAWNLDLFYKFIDKFPGRCIIEIDGFAVDATDYLAEHPGGAGLLRKYAVNRVRGKSLDASWAFGGGLNNHSRAAKLQMEAMRIAKIIPGEKGKKE